MNAKTSPTFLRSLYKPCSNSQNTDRKNSQIPVVIRPVVIRKLTMIRIAYDFDNKTLKTALAGGPGPGRGRHRGPEYPFVWAKGLLNGYSSTRYGTRPCSGVSLWDSLMFGRVLEYSLRANMTTWLRARTARHAATGSTPHAHDFHGREAEVLTPWPLAVLVPVAGQLTVTLGNQQGATGHGRGRGKVGRSSMLRSLTRPRPHS